MGTMNLAVVCVLVVLAASSLANGETCNNKTTDNKGLGGLYSMTRGFIDIVMKKSIITELVKEAGEKKLNDMSSTQLQNAVKNTFIGYAICIAIGVVFIIIMPLVGCCFCCCRCCGNCGGQAREAEKGSDTLKKTCFSIFFVIILAFLLGSVVCIFLNNAMIHDQTKNGAIIGTAVTNLNCTEVYIDDVITDFTKIVTDGFDNTVSGVVGILKATAQTITNKLADEANADEALGSVKKLAKSLQDVNDRLSEVSNTTKALQDGTAHLAKLLTEAGSNLTAILTGCNTTECNDTRDAAESALKLDADFTAVDNVTEKLDTVDNVNPSSLLEKIKEGEDAMMNITSDIKNETDSAIRKVEDQITGTTRKEIIDQVANSTDEIKKIVNFDKFRGQMNDQKDDVDKYGNYIYYAGLGLGCITLLIVDLYFVGLVFLMCCGKGGSSCNQTTGTNFLMAGVGFTFIFAGFLMTLTVVLFLIGVPTYAGMCRYAANLSDPGRTKVFDELLTGFNTSLPYNLTIAGVMEECSKDKSLYNAAKLEERIDIVQYLDINKYPGLTDEIDRLKNKSFDIGRVNILNNDTKTKLDELIDGSLNTINFTSFKTQTDRDVTAGGLGELATTVRNAADALIPFMNETAEELRTQADRLDNIQAHEVTDLETKKNDLGKAIGKLEDILTADGGFTNHTKKLLESLEKAEHDINDNINSRLTEEVGKLAGDVTELISANLTDIANKLINDVGKCREPLRIVQSTVDIGCKSVLDPFNGLWFSLGWFLFFSILALIFAVKLVGVFRATEPDDNKSFQPVDDEAYYRGTAPQQGGYPNPGYRKDEPRDAHNRSSRERRQHRQHQHQHHHRQPDYNSRERSPQHYNNRGGHW